jgi:CheY-like chemotaxis protein
MARVLVIEDNEVNLELMRYLLSAFGHSVATASDGEAALVCVDRERFDLVVCDVHMPKMDGTQFLAAFRQRAAELPPVVAVTASAMVGDREQLLSLGFDGYISKPIDPPTFVQQLEAFLQGR